MICNRNWTQIDIFSLAASVSCDGCPIVPSISKHCMRRETLITMPGAWPSQWFCCFWGPGFVGQVSYKFHNSAGNLLQDTQDQDVPWQLQWKHFPRRLQMFHCGNLGPKVWCRLRMRFSSKTFVGFWLKWHSTWWVTTDFCNCSIFIKLFSRKCHVGTQGTSIFGGKTFRDDRRWVTWLPQSEFRAVINAILNGRYLEHLEPILNTLAWVSDSLPTAQPWLVSAGTGHSSEILWANLMNLVL